MQLQMQLVLQLITQSIHIFVAFIFLIKNTNNFLDLITSLSIMYVLHTRLALREEILTTFLILLLHYSFYGLLCVPFFGELKLHLYKTHQIQRRKSTAVMALHLSKCWTVCYRVVPFIGPCHASPIRPAQPDSPLID